MRLFAGLRERAGWSTRELDGVARVADVWPALDLGEQPDGLLYAVNRAYAPPEQELADGDEVADERAGAIATFVGTTRRQSRGRDVVHLDYEAYEGMAEQVMA